MLNFGNFYLFIGFIRLFIVDIVFLEFYSIQTSDILNIIVSNLEGDGQLVIINQSLIISQTGNYLNIFTFNN